jgi:cytoskeletal protein CcmA (bactofilin family)
MRFIIILLCIPLLCCAAEAEFSKEKSSVVVLAQGVVHEGDYFAMADSVEISGEITGDLYLMASQVLIDGKVDGDVLAIAGSMEISGKVLNNVRLMAAQTLISGSIGRNVTVLGGNVQLLPSARVEGNVVAAAGNVDLSSSIGSDVTVAASNLRLSSQIKDNVQAYVGQLRITSRAQIGGAVDYCSNSRGWIDEGAVIRGTVTMHPSLVHELTRGTWVEGFLVGSKLIALLMNFMYTFVVAWVLMRAFPKNLETALSTLTHHPLRALGFGAMVLILLPLAALMLLMTILGVPFALTLIAMNVVGLYTAKVYSIFWFSNKTLTKIGLKAHRLSTFFVGLICYFLLTAIPIFGVSVSIAAMLFGLGAGVLASVRTSSKT